jgi:hypothetical protein
VRIRNVFLVTILIPAFAASGAGLTAAAQNAHRKPVAHHTFHVTKVVRVAPADEYFGRLKMSILGIRNQLHDLAMRAQYQPEKTADIMGPAGFVEDSIRDWEHKYPADPWLPRNVFLLERLYSQIHTNDGQRSTARTLHWLLARYPHTWYGKEAKTELATAEVK